MFFTTMRYSLIVVLYYTLFTLLSPIALAAPQHGLSRFGSLKYPESFTHFDYINPDAPKGGEIRYASIGTFDTLNPHILKGLAADGLGMTSDTLMVASDDELFSQYGLLAESAEIAKDHSYVEFTLRKEAKWHDGTPVTPDDVVFSFDTLMEKGHPYFKSYYRDIKSATKQGENKVRFTFAQNNNPELPLIIGQLPIISKTYYSTHNFDESTLTAPLGNGPYRVKDVKPGHYIVYERVKDYWGDNVPVNKGRHNFDTIRYDYYRDATVAVEAFKAGQYDIRQENTAKTWATGYDDMAALKDGRAVKEEIPHKLPTGMQGFVFNLRKPVFTDMRVRQALGYAFDYEWTNAQLLHNAYKRTSSYFSNSVYAAEGLPSKAELALLEPLKDKLPPEVFTTAFVLPKTDGSGNIREQLKQADTLLNDAGFTLKDGKRLTKDGKPFEIEILLVQPAFERLVAPMIKNLARLGVTAKIRMVDSAQYQKRLDTFDFDVAVHVFAQSNSPGNEQIDYWHSSKADTEGSKNVIGIKNPAVDVLIEKIITAKTQDDLITACKALDRVLLWNYYVIPNWHIQSFRLVYWNKFGQPSVRPPYGLPLDAWWQKDK